MSLKLSIPSPTYTQTPNDLFDHWLPLLGEVEVKVLLVVIRKTFGWHKERDRISILQLQKLTGSSATHILKAVKSLMEKGLISKTVEGPKGMQVTYYELIVNEHSNNSYPCPKVRGTPDQKSVTKETHTKEKKTAPPNPLKGEAAPPPAAVPSEKKSKKKVSEHLEKVDIPEGDKVDISQKHSDEKIAHAVKWLNDPNTKINKSKAAALKWACQAQPEISPASKNLEMAKKYDGAETTNVKVDVRNDAVIFCLKNSNGAPIILKFNDKEFETKFNEQIKRRFKDVK